MTTIGELISCYLKDALDGWVVDIKFLAFLGRDRQLKQNAVMSVGLQDKCMMLEVHIVRLTIVFEKLLACLEGGTYTRTSNISQFVALSTSVPALVTAYVSVESSLVE